MKKYGAGTLVETIVSLVIIMILMSLVALFFDNAYGSVDDNLKIAARANCELAILTGVEPYDENINTVLKVDQLHKDVDRVQAVALTNSGDTICLKYGIILRR